MDAEQAPLTTDDYQQLHGMLLSDDASVRAHGLGLAHKLTPTEQQAFFDVQQAANVGKGERTRVDDQSPQILAAVGSGASVARAVAAPAASVGARVAAGATNALGQAATQVKYELVRSGLQAIGVPAPLAMAAAIVVSGHKSGARGGAATETAAAESTATAAPTAGALSAVDEAALVKQGYSPAMIDKIRGSLAAPSMATPAPAPATAAPPPTEFQAAQAARQGNSLPDQAALNAEALARRRAAYQASQGAAAEPIVKASGKLRFTVSEWAEFRRLRQTGMSLEKAADAAKGASALADQFGSPSAAEVAQDLARRRLRQKS